MIKTEEILIQLRYARLKIEFIEKVLQQNASIFSGEFQVDTDMAIDALKKAKVAMCEEVKPQK